MRKGKEPPHRGRGFEKRLSAHKRKINSQAAEEKEETKNVANLAQKNPARQYWGKIPNMKEPHKQSDRISLGRPARVMVGSNREEKTTRGTETRA